MFKSMRDVQQRRGGWRHAGGTLRPASTRWPKLTLEEPWAEPHGRPRLKQANDANKMTPRVLPDGEALGFEFVSHWDQIKPDETLQHSNKPYKVHVGGGPCSSSAYTHIQVSAAQE